MQLLSRSFRVVLKSKELFVEWHEYQRKWWKTEIIRRVLVLYCFFPVQLQPIVYMSFSGLHAAHVKYCLGNMSERDKRIRRVVVDRWPVCCLQIIRNYKCDKESRNYKCDKETALTSFVQSDSPFMALQSGFHFTALVSIHSSV